MHLTKNFNQRQYKNPWLRWANVEFLNNKSTRENIIIDNISQNENIIIVDISQNNNIIIVDIL